MPRVPGEVALIWKTLQSGEILDFVQLLIDGPHHRLFFFMYAVRR